MADVSREMLGREVLQNNRVIRAQEVDFGLGSIADLAATFTARARADADRAAVDKANREGFAAGLQRDEQGNLMPTPLREPSSRENIAFNHAYEKGLLAGYENDIRRRAVELRNQTGDDSARFDNAFTAYASELAGRLPKDFQKSVGLIAQEIGVTTYNGILGVERARAYDRNRQEWTTMKTARRDDVLAMAATGGIDTDRYRAALAGYVRIVDDGVKAGFLTDDTRKLELAQVADEGEALAISSFALTAYEKAGGGAAGLRAAEEEIGRIVNDPELKIPESRRLRIAEIGRGRVAREQQLRDASRIEADRRQAEAEKAADIARIKTQDTFLDRLTNPQHEAGPLTADDVMSSNLDPFGKGGKSTFLKLIEDQAAGRNINKTNPTIYNGLFSAIQQQRITTARDLLPFVGNGISPSDYRALSEDIRDTASPAMKAIAEAKKDFYAAAKTRITKGTLVKNDSRGDELFYKFKTAFEQEFARQVGEGKAPMSLLDPGSKEYLGGMVSRFIRTRQQVMSDMARDMGVAAAGDTAGPEETGAPAPGKRPPLADAMGDKLQEILGRFGFKPEGEN